MSQLTAEAPRPLSLRPALPERKDKRRGVDQSDADTDDVLR
jgi:hypothetical protein